MVDQNRVLWCFNITPWPKRNGSFMTPRWFAQSLMHSFPTNATCVLDLGVGCGRLLYECVPKLCEAHGSVMDVVRHCLFGIDTDPMAVEFCRLDLSMLYPCGVATFACCAHRRIACVPSPHWSAARSGLFDTSAAHQHCRRGRSNPPLGPIVRCCA